jgi:hypothetical protein
LSRPAWLILVAAVALMATRPSAADAGAGCAGCYWNGDFSPGNWSQYDSSPAYHPQGDPADFALVSRPAPAGFRYAFRATVRPGDASIVAGEAGERTLLTLFPDDGDGTQGETHGYQASSAWYRDEIYFPTGFQPSQDSDFNWVFQLHNYPDDEGDAMLSCGIDTSTAALGPFEDGGGYGPNPNGPLSIDGGYGPRPLGSRSSEARSSAAFDPIPVGPFPTQGVYGLAASRERFSCRIFGGGSPSAPFNNYNSADWYQNPAVDWSYMVGLPTVQTGVWYDMVWHISWDWRSTASGGHGGLTWYINGQQVASYSGPTLLYLRNAPGTHGGGANQAYLITGYYRPTDNDAGYAQPAASVCHGATMIGPTAASIGEPGLS